MFLWERWRIYWKDDYGVWKTCSRVGRKGLNCSHRNAVAEDIHTNWILRVQNPTVKMAVNEYLVGYGELKRKQKSLEFEGEERSLSHHLDRATESQKEGEEALMKDVTSHLDLTPKMSSYLTESSHDHSFSQHGFQKPLKTKISKQRINWQHNMQEDLKLYACVPAGLTLFVLRLPIIYMLNSNLTPALLPIRPLYRLADVYSAIPLSRTLHWKSFGSRSFLSIFKNLACMSATNSNSGEEGRWE